MFTKEKSVHAAVKSFKEAIGWLSNEIGPRNVERFHERIDDLYKKAVAHGKRLEQRMGKGCPAMRRRK